ncbi:adenylosuccinate lyase [Candidatus Roizmanbacteria bacterium]|nr:adenylosuccinate lyase [Candidatus Roizmanbacteria bacterium]
MPEQERDASFFETYHSVFEWRYGSDEMRNIWSEENRWLKVRDVWIAAATVQNGLGLVTDEELADLVAHRNDLDVARIFALERSQGHDVAAAIAEFGEKATVGGRIVHNGMTSEDVLSNAEMLRMQEALRLTGTRLDSTLLAFADRMEQTKDIPTLGLTHLQAAEPIPLGYRLARYAQDLMLNREQLQFTQRMLRGKGVKGAVGTSASFAHILEGTGTTPREHEDRIMGILGLPAVIIAGQAYPRQLDLRAVHTLSEIAASLHRFSLDQQIFQSSFAMEWEEPRRKNQIGSSAMPWKRNPNVGENICSLAMGVTGKTFDAWMIAATETGERTLRDSAGKRSWLPESFLIVDEALMKTERNIRGMKFNEEPIRHNLERFSSFSALELVLAEAVHHDANRQEMHEIIREHSMTAAEAIQRGEENPIQTLIMGDSRITNHVSVDRIEELFQEVYTHVGDAPERTQEFADLIREAIAQDQKKKKE